MARYVGFVLRFLLFHLSFAFTNGNAYNLHGNKTDICFQASQKDSAECLQGLIESYYGKYFTRSCPEFPQILADLRCRGCPWNRLNPEKVNPEIADEYREAGNETALFNEPGTDCIVSKYVSGFESYQGVRNYIVRWGVTGSIPILFSTGVIVQYTSDPGGLTRPSFLGK